MSAKKKTKSRKKTGKKPAAKAGTTTAAPVEGDSEHKAKQKKAAGARKSKRVSALDAAAQVLGKAEQPMRAQELIAAMAEQGLWKSPAGKTPHATLYAAILREIGKKGDAARFQKVDRGLFEING